VHAQTADVRHDSEGSSALALKVSLLRAGFVFSGDNRGFTLAGGICLLRGGEDALT
jgi:hypothetical protein